MCAAGFAGTVVGATQCTACPAGAQRPLLPRSRLLLDPSHLLSSRVRFRPLRISMPPSFPRAPKLGKHLNRAVRVPFAGKFGAVVGAAMCNSCPANTYADTVSPAIPASIWVASSLKMPALRIRDLLLVDRLGRRPAPHALPARRRRSLAATAPRTASSRGTIDSSESAAGRVF